MTSTEPTIDGSVAAVLDLYNFRPTRQRPKIVWVRGRRASGRRIIAVLEPDGTLLLHRPARRGAYTERIPNVGDQPAEVGYAIRRILSR